MKKTKELLELINKEYPSYHHSFTLNCGKLMLSTFIGENVRTFLFDESDFERPVEDLWEEVKDLLDID